MRSTLARYATAAVAALIGGGLALFAAPVAPPEARPQTAESTALHNEAFQYASAMVQVTALIEQQYVRPVSQADLLEAALTGLYEAARQPLPAGLHQDLHRLAPPLEAVSTSIGVVPVVPAPQPSPGELLNLVVRLRERLGTVDALRGRRDLYVSLRALPRALDPYCGLAGPKEFTRYGETGEDRLGLDLANLPAVTPSRTSIALNAGADFGAPPEQRPGDWPTGPLRVVNVTPGGPGQHAGLRPGDAITRVNGQPVEALKPATLLRALGVTGQSRADGAPPAACQLTVQRPGRPAPLEFTLVPAAFTAESVFGNARRPDGSWDFLADPRDKLAYVRVGAIDGHTHEQVQQALRTLKAQGVRGLVLDLRWCPGGLLTPAAGVARLFLPAQGAADDGRRPWIARTRDRNGDERPVNEEDVETGYNDFPLVVLVNGDTSGGGELIAAALQDHGRAVVAGQRTVGKASVQSPLSQHGLNTPVPIPQFKITGSTFLRPSGKNLQRFPDSKPTDDWGIRPDSGRELPLSVELGRQLKEWYQWQVLRPYDSREALPLDDPENDPQRQGAFQMLRGMVK